MPASSHSTTALPGPRPLGRRAFSVPVVRETPLPPASGGTGW